MALIEIHNEKCKRCYACVRVCPVKAIKVGVNQEFPQIIEERCIGCGSCIASCSPGAIVYEDATSMIKHFFAEGQKVAAVVDPSISAEFPDITDYRKFVEMIRKLGFGTVIETSFGIDLIAYKYKELFDNFRGKYFITANCPSVVAYIEKFHPDLISNLAPIISPMVVSAMVVRAIYGEQLKVVFVGPCIAAKLEARETKAEGKIDAVLTFQELRALFKEFSITEGAVEYSDFDPPHGYRGGLYPIANGILQTADISENLLYGSVVTVEGSGCMLDSVKQFENQIDIVKRNFNIFYDEGCIMGPGMSAGGEKYVRRTLVADYVNKRLRAFNGVDWRQHIESFGNLNYLREYKNDDQRLPQPSDEQIEQILTTLGNRGAGHDLDCTSCGYTSCRDFATSVAQGLTKTDMCITYTLKNRHDYIRTLKLTNEKLAKTQDALKESEKTARREQQLAKEASETVSTMLQKLPSSVVIVDDTLHIIQANHSFIDLLGEDAKAIDEVVPGLVSADLKTLLPYSFYNLFSFVLQNNESILNRDVHLAENLLNISIFPIRKNKVVGAVIRDMYAPEVRKEEVIKRVSEVIDKNLAMVQQIGFLLGEGAAETEQMMNSIIEFHKMGKPNV
jgi:Na+-translocating ferredoxin:NAD+ oxidoreductase RNF subunit RnfB